MQYLATKGQLKQRIAEHKLWNWGIAPETIEDTGEKAIQINVITLKAYLAEVALGQALDEQIDDIKKVCDRASELLSTELTSAKQFVHVTNDYIQVGINCDLIDNEAIMLALKMVAQLPSLEPGTTIQIGEMVQVYENNLSYRKRSN
jgi:hypothetical protein